MTVTWRIDKDYLCSLRRASERGDIGKGEGEGAVKGVFREQCGVCGGLCGVGV